MSGWSPASGLSISAEADQSKLTVTTEIVEHLGGETIVYAGHGGREVLTVGMQDGRAIKPGDTFDAEFDPARLLFFGKSGERI